MKEKKLAKEKIKKLVEKYEQIVNSRQFKKYTEEETKKDFIQPLFEALSWDIYDKKEVSAEEKIKSAGRVDYGFYLNERPKFYVEAKSLKEDLYKQEYAEQVIKYSWNKSVVWAVLTNFKSIKIFNAQNISETLSGKLLFEISYSEYIERFEQLWLLSKESFEKELIDKYATEHGKKLQKVSITSVLSKDLSDCRDILIDELAKYNEDKNISSDLLDEGVQRLLDRLIFIRVAEDRGIEEKTLEPMLHQWQNSKKEEPLFKSMVSRFRELNDIYNSNLFKKHSFEDWKDWAGKATGQVIKKLSGKEGYYEYDFKDMPADVLGAVYENYLGHRLSKSKKGLTVDKDAKKRKEQGIYYTPSFIVDYIVRNVLKPVLDKCKSINDLKKIKVLDPACGSGSFLIKALEVINDKYKEFKNPGNEFTKISILTENIYGVDLDEQAVEITRLNLLISALDKRMKLPLLDHIKNGNSLISGTDEELKKYFGSNFRDKKPFNWQEQFPEVFKQGGFDVIIGNPPYVNLANIKDANEREYLKGEYKTAKNKSDLYSFFIEKATTLLCPSGTLGFIVSNSWLGTDSFSKFRKFLIENMTVTQMVELPLGVFEQATVTPVLIFLENCKASKNNKIQILSYKENKFEKLPNGLNYERIIESPNYNFSFSKEFKIKIPTIKLGDIVKFSLGIKTSNDEKFILDKKIDNDCYKLLRGKDVNRYGYNYAGKWIWYKPDLMMQKVGAGPRKLEFFLKDKILFKDVATEICAVFDNEKYLSSDTLSLIYDTNGKYNLKFVLALLNSKFVNKWYSINFQSGLHIKINELQNIPIPKIDFSNPKEKEKHDELVKLADKMLKLNKELQKTPENSDKWNSIKSEIEKTDKKIDEEVYKLYGLTDKEIKIVENK